jgi:hypothetical protein
MLAIFSFIPKAHAVKQILDLEALSLHLEKLSTTSPNPRNPDSTSSTVRTIQGLDSELRDIGSILVSDPWDTDVLRPISSIFKRVKSLIKPSTDTFLYFQLQMQYQHMVSDAFAFHYLHVVCLNHCREALRPNGGVAKEWMKALTRRVEVFCSGSTDKEEFPSTIFLHESEMPNSKAVLKRSQLLKSTSANVVERSVLLVIAQWLGLPLPNVKDTFDGFDLSPLCLRGSFIYFLVKASGNPHILLIDEFYKVFHSVKTQVFQNSKKQRFTTVEWLGLVGTWRSLPALTEPKTQKLLNNVVEIAKSYFALPESRFLLSEGQNSVPPIPGPDRPTLAKQRETNRILAVNTIKALVIAGRASEDESLEGLVDSTIFRVPVSQVIGKIRGCPEKFHPDRDCVPSRHTVTEDGGPYSAEYLKTCAGIYSIVIARAYSFGNNHFLENNDKICGLHPRNVFRSHQDLVNSRASYRAYILATLPKLSPQAREDLETQSNIAPGSLDGRIESPNIYGSPSRDRTEGESHRRWWLFAEKFSSLLENSSGKLSWASTWALVNPSGKAKKRSNEDDGDSEADELNITSDDNEPLFKLLRGLGPLLTYLLMIDLATAGLIEVPTTAEVAARISSKLGNGKGLEALGLIKTKPKMGGKKRGKGQKQSTNKEDYAAQFTELYTELEARLSPKEKEIINLSPWLLEHTLCKVSRFVGLEYMREQTLS